MNKRAVGTQYETMAASYLASCGYRIIETNFFCRYGEIDLVGEENGILCFVEVKYRQSLASGFPQEAVGRAKQLSIRRCAGIYLSRRGYREETPCRFDVIGICPPDIWLVRNAFGGL